MKNKKTQNFVVRCKYYTKWMCQSFWNALPFKFGNTRRNLTETLKIKICVEWFYCMWSVRQTEIIFTTLLLKKSWGTTYPQVCVYEKAARWILRFPVQIFLITPLGLHNRTNETHRLLIISFILVCDRNNIKINL